MPSSSTQRSGSASTAAGPMSGRSRFSGRAVAGLGATFGFVALLGLAVYSPSAATPDKAAAKPQVPAPASLMAGLTPDEVQTFSDRFAKDIWPVMQENCVPCHGQKNASQLLLSKDSRASFLKMLGEGFFDVDNHSSVTERVTTTDKQIVMPPTSMGPLPRPQIVLMTKFAEDLKAARAHGGNPDEQFPAHLTLAFGGKKQTEGLDNTFVTFRQLRGKVKAIFADDWVRDDKDLFVDNVQMFGGADFIKRFDETAKASPTFLTGVDMMSRDVASRAYLTKYGPFEAFPDALPAPTSLAAPTVAYKTALTRLYNRMLFRDPTPAETTQAWNFLRGVYQKQTLISQTAPQDVRFALTVKDEKGMSVTEDVTVRVSADSHALYSEFLNQGKDAADDKNKTATQTLARPFTFAPGDDGQKIFLTNANTSGNVSVASVTLRGPLPLTTEKTIAISDPQARPEGAWRIKTDDNFTSYEDNNENKGASHVTFPVSVDKPGKYEVAVTWRRFKAPTPAVGKKGAGAIAPRPTRGAPTQGAENVIVEVVSRDKDGKIALPPTPPVPPKGQAVFYVDETLDTIPYYDLKTAFQFGPNDGVEVKNEGTRKRVVADAVRLFPNLKAAPNGQETSLVLSGNKAVGRKKWTLFTQGTFRPHNLIGPDVFQDDNATGEKQTDLSLLFQASSAEKATDKASDKDADKPGDTTQAFSPLRYYRVGLVFPGQVENETRVPVVVHGQASSPIVQVVAPLHAHVGSPITLDASSTYNLQHSTLSYKWTQIGGPRVVIKDPTAPRLQFTAPTMTAQQAAWEGLCRALIAHPDFLFTRPRSLAETTDPKTRRRLLLVKIAQDLLGRTPSPADVAKVDSGTPLSALVDTYLQTPEFRDFYFHRVRLYLESHGTPEQDEPARLWSYVCANDLPFKQILTADYTVGMDNKKQSRPPYYGKTGVLTMKGFIQGKPGLPHFNYPAQVTEKFLGYVFEVPDEVLQTRSGITAAATTDPNSMCYTCHKVLTPLAYQRQYWDDDGNFRAHDETGMAMDDTDNNLVASYPFKGAGLEAFATQAQNKERFIRTILQTHFVWYFGRELRYDTDERDLYKRLWDTTAKNNYALRPVIKAIVLSPEYLNGTRPSATPPNAPGKRERMAKLAAFHTKNVVENR